MRIVKEVVAIGNGAAVYVPKEYNGKQVLITLPEGIEELQRRVLSLLVQYMPNIIGVYLYGSYARKEEDTRSDVDILVVTQEKDEQIKRTLSEFDARVVTYKDLKKSIENYPLFLVPSIQEARVFLNPVVLAELKKIPINLSKLQWHFEEIQRIIKIVESSINISEEEQISATYLASVMMRIRVCFLIQSIIKKSPYTHEKLKGKLIKQGFQKNDVERWFSIYQELREEQETSLQVKKEEVQELLTYLKRYVHKVNNETRKKAQKGN